MRDERIGAAAIELARVYSGEAEDSERRRPRLSQPLRRGAGVGRDGARFEETAPRFVESVHGLLRKPLYLDEREAVKRARVAVQQVMREYRLGQDARDDTVGGERTPEPRVEIAQRNEVDDGVASSVRGELGENVFVGLDGGIRSVNRGRDRDASLLLVRERGFGRREFSMQHRKRGHYAADDDD